MSSDDTIYHIILIYGSQCTVGNGRGERWRACNIQLYSELYISLFFFFTRTLGTASPLPCFRKKKNPHICIILCSPSSKFPLPTICGCAALPWEHAVSSEFLCLRYHSAFALQSHEWGHYKGLLDD